MAPTVYLWFVFNLNNHLVMFPSLKLITSGNTWCGLLINFWDRQYPSSIPRTKNYISNGYFNGGIKDFRMYSKVLT
eukprot:gene49232-66855_t